MGNTAVIMAGGQGTRLSQVTGPLPKAMVNVKGTQEQNFGKAKDTILEHQIKILAENGFDNFVIVVGNKKEYIKNAFTNETINQNIPGYDLKLDFFEEPTPLGTAGSFCFKELQDKLPEDFLFTYSDNLFDVNVSDMFKKHKDQKSDVTILISPTSQPDDRDLFVFDKSGDISDIIHKQGKGEGPRTGLFPNTSKNAIMIFNKDALLSIMPKEEDVGFIDMEQDVIPTMIYQPNSKVTAWKTTCYTKDIGTVDRYFEGLKDNLAGIPERRNPSKYEQNAVVFFESDFMVRSGVKTQINQQLANTIKDFNQNGIITVLYKDVSSKGDAKRDWVIDTRLNREGDGAYVNEKFDEDENLFEFMKENNVPQSNLYIVHRDDNSQMEDITDETPLSCTIQKLDQDAPIVCNSFFDAKYRIMREVKFNPVEQQNPSQEDALESSIGGDGASAGQEA